MLKLYRNEHDPTARSYRIVNPVTSSDTSTFVAVVKWAAMANAADVTPVGRSGMGALLGS